MIVSGAFLYVSAGFTEGDAFSTCSPCYCIEKFPPGSFEALKAQDGNSFLCYLCDFLFSLLYLGGREDGEKAFLKVQIYFAGKVSN